VGMTLSGLRIQNPKPFYGARFSPEVDQNSSAGD
jgi:hypothetical protein